MEEAKQISITIVNKNYPPNPGITGESANELAAWLLKQGCKVKVVHTDGSYAGGASVGNIAGNVITVKSVYNGKNKFIRLFGSFIESYRLIKKAKKDGEGLRIIMTDPPFLILWSSILLKKQTWAYWSMDLYPEAFVAGKLVSTNNPLYRCFKKFVHKNPPDYLIALGKYQLDFLKNDYQSSIPSVLLPCGISTNKKRENTSLPSWKENNGKIYLGYCGNLGEAHSLNFILKVIELLDPQKFILILSVYGSKASSVLNVAKNKPGIIITERVERDQLSFIDVHLVTLLPEWNNICVPSKAVSAVCEGGAILFCGNKENDNWYYLQEAGWIIEDTNIMIEQINKWFDDISLGKITAKKINAEKLSQNLHEMKNSAFIKIMSFAS